MKEPDLPDIHQMRDDPREIPWDVLHVQSVKPREQIPA